MKDLDNLPPLKDPYIQKIINVVIGFAFLAVIVTLIGINGWEEVIGNFTLTLLFLVMSLPFLFKALNPAADFDKYLKTLVERSKLPDKTLDSYLMGYIENVMAISAIYTVLGYVRYNLDFIEDKYWAFILPIFILFLLLRSALCLVRVLYQIGLLNIGEERPISKVRKGFKAFMVGAPLLYVQVFILQAGVKSIESFDPDASIKKIDERIKFYHENENK